MVLDSFFSKVKLKIFNKNKCNSSHGLYNGEIYHHRRFPKKHAFNYKVFMFYLHINKLPSLIDNPLISINRFNMFSFYYQDYLTELSDSGPYTSTSCNPLFDRINHFLIKKKLILKNPQFFLLTNLRFFNYVFNPVSFYYCYDGEKPICALAEVHNTFKERKIYFIEEIEKVSENAKDQDSVWFIAKQYKDFYVSPFSHPHTTFNFKLGEARSHIKTIVNELDKEKMYFHSYFTGEYRYLTVWNLAKCVLWFFPVTFKIIFSIHWQAFLLWLRRVPFYRKQEHSEFQKHFYRK